MNCHDEMMKAIEVQDLTFTYPGASAPVVSNVTFAVQQGEIFGFLGPSGAGKSTTQRILIRLLRQYEGRAAVFGREIRTWKSDYQERIGVTFELPNHYLKLTARENLALFGALYQGPLETTETLLSLVGLEGDADTRVGQYSKGMQMRLSFARALLHRPELLFLDEPTAGLDPGNARRITNHIKQLKAEGRTVFLTTHNMWVAAELCDRVAFLVDGRIVLIDSPRQLKLDHGVHIVKVEYRAAGTRAAQTFDLHGIGENQAFLELLRTREIETMHTQEATLEDIFIKVTGQTLT